MFYFCFYYNTFFSLIDFHFHLYSYLQIINIKLGKIAFLCDFLFLLVLYAFNTIRLFTDSDTLSVLSAKLDSAEQNLIAAKLDEQLQLINDARYSQVCKINH